LGIDPVAKKLLPLKKIAIKCTRAKVRFHYTTLINIVTFTLTILKDMILV